MKKFLIALIIFIFSANVACAEKNLDFEDAQMRLICALCSLSSYSGNESVLTREMLFSRGWRINAVEARNKRANAKAYLISREFEDNHKVKILVIAGTEDLKDVEVDFRIGKVSLHEGEENIFVHRGFRDYADTALSGGVKEVLVDELKNNPAETLYITGHSLGGAVALISAIRLIDAGVDKNQIKVITFGAPAIGNRALADAYENKIDLTRIGISGDIIKKSLQVLGYVHFGNYLNYKVEKADNHYPHDMELYLECALKNYYDNGGFESLLDVDTKNKIDTPVYVAPLKILQKSFSPSDQKYILAFLNDGLKSRLTNLTFAEPRFTEIKKSDQISYHVTEFIKPAKEAGCKYILVQFLGAQTVKESQQRETRVTLDEMIFDLNGSLLSMQTSRPTTENLTIIEAAAFAQEHLRNHREKIFNQ